MIKRGLFLLFSLLLSISVYSLQNSVIINISERNEISGNIVRLSDISDIITNNNSIREKISDIIIYSFENDNKVIISQDQFVNTLRNNTNNDFEIYLQIPDEIFLSRKTRGIDQNWLEKEIKTLYKTKLNDLMGDIDYRFQIKSIKTEIDTIDIIPYAIESRQRFTPRSSGFDRVSINIIDSHGNKINTHINIRYQLEIKQAVIREGLSRGDIIDINNISFNYVNYQDRLFENHVHIDDIIGKAANRSLSPGSMILSNMIKKPILINRGEIVDIIINTGSIQLRTKGRARSNAVLGDHISVQPISYNKIVQGIVQEDKTVLVEVF